MEIQLTPRELTALENLANPDYKTGFNEPHNSRVHYSQVCLATLWKHEFIVAGDDNLVHITPLGYEYLADQQTSDNRGAQHANAKRFL